MAGHNGIPNNYEQKFSDFIELLSKPEPDLVVIHNPNVLGDNYEEVIESLNRLADAEKQLVIVPRKERGQ